MATKKSQAKKTNPKSPENPIKILKDDTCQSLHYQIGIDEEILPPPLHRSDAIRAQ